MQSYRNISKWKWRGSSDRLSCDIAHASKNFLLAHDTKVFWKVLAPLTYPIHSTLSANTGQNILCNLSFFSQNNAIPIPACSTCSICSVLISFNPTGEFSCNDHKKCAIPISCPSKRLVFCPSDVRKLHCCLTLHIKPPTEHYFQL